MTIMRDLEEKIRMYYLRNTCLLSHPWSFAPSCGYCFTAPLQTDDNEDFLNSELLRELEDTNEVSNLRGSRKRGKGNKKNSDVFLGFMPFC